MLAELKFLFFAALLLLLSNHLANGQCTSHKVTGISLSDQTGCSATVNWIPGANTAYFEVSKKSGGSSQWSAPVNVGYVTSYTFTNLKLNRKYSFRVTAYCAAGAAGKARTVTQQNFFAEPPDITVSECIFPQQIHVKWQPCSNSAYNRIETRRENETVWTNHFTGTTTEFFLTVSGVEPVQYRITCCVDTSTGWTAVNSIYLAPTSTGHKPNIISIMLDDARFDAYSCNGPATVPLTPNIDRIANEGANFKDAYVVYSLCNPSRATFFTGLYPHHHGARNNEVMFYKNLPTVAKSISTSGYYTAMIGKYMNAIDNNPVPQPGWDYWMARYKSIDTNPTFEFSDSSRKQIFGNINDIVTDTAVKIIQNSGAPFYIALNYATHPPYHARSQDDSLYQDDTFPLPDNYYKFTSDYPSFLYPTQSADSPDSLEQEYRNMYEVIYGVDVNIGRLFDALQGSGKLDSTLILFTSDNGYMMGEHFLKGKRMTYDENARVPIFIRYPAWFAPLSLDENDFALNVDLAPTLLDAAGIPDAFPTDGISLRRLLYDQSRREEMYYEVTDAIVQIANSRSVFSKDYVYSYYYCNQTTEEFFDLTLDPEENMNRINSPEYQDLIQHYRNELDSLKTVLTDTVTESTHSCFLANGFNGKWESREMTSGAGDLKLLPNPARDQCTIQFGQKLEHEGKLMLMNSLCLILHVQPLAAGIDRAELDTKNLAEGVYLIQVRSDSVDWRSPLMISR